MRQNNGMDLLKNSKLSEANQLKMTSEAKRILGYLKAEKEKLSEIDQLIGHMESVVLHLQKSQGGL